MQSWQKWKNLMAFEIGVREGKEGEDDGARKKENS